MDNEYGASEQSTYTDVDFERDNELRQASATAALRYEAEHTKRVLGEGVHSAITAASGGLTREARRRRPASRKR